MTSALSHRWTKRDEQLLAKLYAEGVSDAAIATKLGRTKKAVKSRRKVRRLVSNQIWTNDQKATVKRLFATTTAKDIGAIVGKTDQQVYRLAKRMGLSKIRHFTKAQRAALAQFIKSKHKLGWSDSELAAAWSKLHPELHVSREWVTEVRRLKLNLPHNAYSDHRSARVAAKTQEQLDKAGLPSIGHLRAEAYKAFCVRQGWPQVERPRLAQILNVLYEQGPKTLPELAAALGMRFRSSKHHPNGVFLTGNGPGGSYAGQLTKMGLVVRLGRKARYAAGSGKARFVYAIAPGIVRGPIQKRKVS